LVDADSSNDIRNECGHTPLHLAAAKGRVNIVQKLVAAGANTRVQDWVGETPLHKALFFWKEAAAKLLVHADSRNSIQDTYGCTPLHYAAEKGYVKIVKKLVVSGASMCLQDKSGCTPLHNALYMEKRATAEFLVDLGGGNNIQNNRGHTPLHIAAEKGCVGAVKKLLMSDVCPHAVKDDQGQYPLHVALKERQDDVLKSILAMCACKGIYIHWTEMELPQDQVWRCISLLSEYYNEIRQMKNTKIGGSTVSYHDLAKYPECKVALYLENEDIRKALDHDHVFQNFPNYVDIIAFKVKNARKRKALTDRCKGCISVMTRKLPPLLPTCWEIVLLYLSRRDLRNFIKAAKFKD
ncbi:ankyrin repeat and protein kinase domain-containing protein 1-like, partial [Uloborus diversus]|uniref:ankyrin repeat and protein kinase domain-containing protein 1-like n=1 Tax=Uloborus diversus TaxID=327109 RepID=UPI0024097030